MSTVVDELLIEMGLDTKKLDSGLAKAQEDVIGFSKKMRENGVGDIFFKDRKSAREFSWSLAEMSEKIEYFGKPLEHVETHLKTIGDLFEVAKNGANGLFGIIRGIAASTLFTAGLAWIGKFVSSFKDMKKEAEVLHQLSKDLNVDTEQISAWSNAIEYSGGTAKSFQGTLRHLRNDMLSIATIGKARSKPLYESLGIDTTKFSGKSVFDLIDDITKAVEGMDKAKSRDILQRLGFDADAIEVIQKGRTEIDKLLKQQREWGVYTKKETDAIDKMNKAIKQMSLVLKSTFIPLFSKIVVTTSKFVNYFSKGAVIVRDNLDVIKRAVLLVAAAFSTKLYKALIDLGFLAMKNPFALFIIALTALLLLLEDLWVYAKGGKTAFGNMWKSLGTPEEVMNGFKKVGEWLSNIAKFIQTDVAKFGALFIFLAKGIVMLIGLIGGLPVAVGVAIAGAIAFFITYWEELKTAVETVAKMFVSLFGSGGIVWSTLAELGQAILDFFTNPIEKIKQAWADFKEWFRENFSSFEAVTNRMANTGHSAIAAREAMGNYTDYDDNRVIKIYPTNESASRGLIKGLNLTPQSNTGNRP